MSRAALAGYEGAAGAGHGEQDLTAIARIHRVSLVGEGDGR